MPGSRSAPASNSSDSRNAERQQINASNQLHLSHAVDVLELLEQRWHGTPCKHDSTPSAARQARPARRLRRGSSSDSLPSHQVAAPETAVLARPSLRIRAKSNSAERERQAAIIQELPGIGTWAGRQRLFGVPRPSSVQAHVDEAELVDPSGIDETIHGNGATDLEQEPHDVAIRPQAGAADGSPSVSASNLESPGSEARLHEAWRWRFTRKWEAEQRRAAVVDPSAVEDSENDLAAIEYVQACGVGVDLQVIPPMRRERSRNIATGARARRPGGATGFSATGGGLHSSASASTMLFDVDASFIGSDLLGHEDVMSLTPGAVAAETPDALGGASVPASRDLLSVAVRGRELLARQKEIEKEAASRWENIERTCSGQAWAGSLLAPVQIDMVGRFPYILIRVAEPGSGIGNGTTSRQRLIVRGRHKAMMQELVEETIGQAAGVCAEHFLPMPVIELVGGGFMEWRQDTDRHLILSPAPLGFLAEHNGKSNSPPKMSGNVCGLVASLVRQSLPCHFLVRQETNGFVHRNGISAM